MSQYRKTLLDEWPPQQLAVHGAFHDEDTREYARSMNLRVPEAVVVKADAVARVNAGERSFFDMPGAVPPFPYTWIDIHDDTVMRDLVGIPIKHWGAMFMTDGVEVSALHADQAAARWVVTACLVWKQPDGVIVGPVVYAYGVDAAGDILGAHKGGHPAALLGMRTEDPAAPMMRDLTMLMLFPCILALSLMGCKNVSRTEQRPPPALSRRHEERHGRPLVRYYTLDIEPMRKVLRTEGRMDEVGLKRALHLCRGHFKDYREGGGLFGKHKGLYWWDANVRGSVEQGIVAKDYALKMDKANE